MPWAVAAAGIGAAATVYSSSQQKGAVDSAAGKANAVSQQAIDTATTDYAPYTEAGTAGLKSYADFTGINGPDAAAAAMGQFVASPGYGYQVQQGLRAVDAGAASRGMLRSGATLKAEQTLGSNLANQDFGNYLGRLNTLATTGLSATNNLVNTLSGQATQQQQTLVSQGANDASIYGNTGKSLTGLLGNANADGSLTKAVNGLFSPSSTSNTGFDVSGFGASQGFVY